MSEVIQLISLQNDTDQYGDPIVVQLRREVVVTLLSVGQKEFYEAHAVGLKPEIKFVLSDYLDYADEPQVEYDGKLYHVLRTFRKGRELEIVVSREVNSA